ncbi:MAG: thioredoxin domain-containing protein [Phycisphaerales bacterium]|nr:thioredoxin domain-containing protein [Phycisphaerales bacterium]
MILRCLMVIIGLSLTSSLVLGEPPFLDLTYPEAIKKAGEEKKQVFIDFYTTWCGPCKMLDRTTWKDKAVQAWLLENTIPLKIDAEKQKDLARKLKIRGYPTMVFIHPDGAMGGRLVGYRDAKKFLSEAKDALIGMTPLKRAQMAFANEPESTNTHYDLGQQLAAAGTYDKALEHFKWCWIEGVDEPGFGGVRRSYLLNNLERLAKRHKPAQSLLETWLAETQDRLESGKAMKLDAGDYAALHTTLGGPASERLAFYDKIMASQQGESYNGMIFFLQDELYDANRFEELAKTINLKSLKYQIDNAANRYRQPDAPIEMLDYDFRNHGRDIEVLFIIGREEDANKIIDMLKAFNPKEEHVNIILTSKNAASKRGAKNLPSDDEIRARLLSTAESAE